MKSISFKKLSLILLCGLIMLGSLLLVGCNENEQSYEEQGFVAVCRVNYISKMYVTSEYRDTMTTLNSNYEFTYESQEITEDEYNNLDCDVKNFPGTNMSNDKSISFETGKIYKYSRSYSSGTYYYTWSISAIKEYYLYIKILNENTFELIDTDGSHSVINTSYFEIEYFI